jgi:hypothetical protein
MGNYGMIKDGELGRTDGEDVMTIFVELFWLLIGELLELTEILS